MDRKPRAANPRGVSIRELFRDDPARETYNMNASGSPLGAIFAGIDRVLRLSDPLRPRGRRQKAIETAMDFVKERLNGEDGLGGIFPAMANAAMAFPVLGYDWTDPDSRQIGRAPCRARVWKYIYIPGGPP